jgi:SulP family sulfate permease
MVEEAEHHERQVLIAGANAKVKARLKQFRIHELTGSRREALAHAAQELDPH